MNWIASVFALISILFGLLFGLDLRGFFNRASRPVAYLKSEMGTVRRLAKSQLTWDRAAGGTRFGAGDTISTGEESRASLVFYGGGELDLDPGAMVVLVGSLEELKLNFLSGRGRVRVAKDAKTQFKVTRAAAHDSRVEVAVVDHIETRAEAESDTDSQAARPPVPRSPEAPWVPPAIRQEDIRSPAQSLGKNGEMLSLAKLPSAPQVKFPDTDAVIDLSEDRVAKLEWSAPSSPEKIKSYEIVLRDPQKSSEGEGEKILHTERPDIPLMEVKPGKYLWSVRSVDANGKRSPASPARMIELRAPVQIDKPVALPVSVE